MWVLAMPTLPIGWMYQGACESDRAMMYSIAQVFG
jgi:hypothetical protein